MSDDQNPQSVAVKTEEIPAAPAAAETPTVEKPPTDTKPEESPVVDAEIVPETAPIEEVAPVAPAIENAPPQKIWDIEEASKKPEETSAKTEESAVNEELKINEEAVEEGGVKPFLVRTEETGDKVYCVRENKRYWVRNPDTLSKMGFNLGQEKRVTFAELLKWPEGEPIDLTVPGAVYPWEKPEAEQEADDSGKPYKVWS